MFKKALLLFFILSVVLFFSCRKELKKAYWDTEILAPIVDATFDISNILPDSVTHHVADSSLEIVYRQGIYNFDVGNLFTMPDTGLHTFYTIPINYPLDPGQVIPFPSANETVYQLPGVELKMFKVKTGKV
ncbi:MAG TPA: hypothetical protein VFF27_04420, partial [Bacteroidia bacterium]|nr:hypothetical protein [Bacteroidia bacterium]